MALVRCSIHDIPYNDSNPRGCPACAREREGTDPRADAIRELARASTALRRPELSVPEPAAPAPPRPSRVVLAGPVTEPPRAPSVEEGTLRQLLRWANERRVLAAASVAIAGVVVYFAATAGPDFVPGADPPHYTGSVNALPVEPGQPIPVVFAILGSRPPRAHPDYPSLARYAYGTRLTIDALNGEIYQITIGVPNWRWRGLTVGLPERQVQGTLALLGPAETIEPEEDLPTRDVGGYAVYPSLAERPRRLVRVEVRPPNGCVDVFVELRPLAVGIVQSGDRRYAAIGQPGVSPQWVSTEVRAVNRAVSGPGGPSACPGTFARPLSNP